MFEEDLWEEKTEGLVSSWGRLLGGGGDGANPGPVHTWRSPANHGSQVDPKWLRSTGFSSAQHVLPPQLADERQTQGVLEAGVLEAGVLVEPVTAGAGWGLRAWCSHLRLCAPHWWASPSFFFQEPE